MWKISTISKKKNYPEMDLMDKIEELELLEA